MVKKLLNLIKYSGNIFLLFKLPFSRIILKLGFEETATKIMCNKPIILYTPFGNYLATTLYHYFGVVENYEPEIKKEIDIISEQTFKKQPTFLINIGANLGRRSIGLAKQYGYNVICFEPGPSTFKNLRINTILSDLDDKIELYNIGLGNINDIMKFSMKSDGDATAHIVDDKNIETESNLIYEIPVKRFDDLGIDSQKIDNTRLVIIDVEGYELNVLKGMEKTLKQLHNIHIIMEIWETQKNKKDTINFMKNLGYSEKKIDSDNWLFFK